MTRHEQHSWKPYLELLVVCENGARELGEHVAWAVEQEDIRY